MLTFLTLVFSGVASPLLSRDTAQLALCLQPPLIKIKSWGLALWLDLLHVWDVILILSLTSNQVAVPFMTSQGEGSWSCRFSCNTDERSKDWAFLISGLISSWRNIIP